MMYDSTAVGVTGAFGASPPVFPSPRCEEEEKSVEGRGGRGVRGWITGCKNQE